MAGNDDDASTAQRSGGPVIRARQPGDLGACVELLAAVHVADGYPLQWPATPIRWLAPSRLLAAWVAVDHGAISGHVALRGAAGAADAAIWSAASGLPAERIAEVARLFVAPTARGHGAGAALLAAAVGGARSRGLRGALVVLDHDRAAIALYERAGWRCVASDSAPWTLSDGEPVVLHYYLAPE